MGDKLTKAVERVQVRGTPITVSDYISSSVDDDDEVQAIVDAAAAAARARGDLLLAGLLEAEELEDE